VRGEREGKKGASLQGGGPDELEKGQTLLKKFPISYWKKRGGRKLRGRGGQKIYLEG